MVSHWKCGCRSWHDLGRTQNFSQKDGTDSDQLHKQFLSTSDRTKQVSCLHLWESMKHGYICMIQRQKNNLRGGDTEVHLIQKSFENYFESQPPRWCFLGQRWNIANWLLQRRCNNHSKLLHISLGQSAPQMVREAAKRCCFSRTIPPHTWLPSHTRSWLICTLKCWNTLPFHPIWPLQTTNCSHTFKNIC